MIIMKKEVKVIDTTFRDGSHAINHEFTTDQIKQTTKNLASAGCRLIEVTHGDGLGGSSYQYGFSSTPELELIQAAVDVAAGISKEVEIGCLLIPGIGTVNDLHQAVKAGIQFVRVATHCTEADVGLQHIKTARETGLRTFGFLMMVHMQEKEALLRQADLFVQSGAEAVVFADSAGALIPEQVYDNIHYLSRNLSVPVGFHAHNNLGLAIANSLAAIKAGAVYIDATLRGIGASAGNAAHEVIEAVLHKYDITSGSDLYKLMDAADDFAKIVPVNVVIDKYSMTIGYAGVYGSFYLHAIRAAKQFQIDARDILVELGRMKAVGGQEDMIIDVAYKIAKNKKT